MVLDLLFETIYFFLLPNYIHLILFFDIFLSLYFFSLIFFFFFYMYFCIIIHTLARENARTHKYTLKYGTLKWMAVFRLLVGCLWVCSLYGWLVYYYYCCCRCLLLPLLVVVVLFCMNEELCRRRRRWKKRQRNEATQVKQNPRNI